MFDFDNISEAMKEFELGYHKDATEWYKSLTREEQMYAFYTVTKKIYLGDMVENGSYRHVLYDTFGFDTSSYVIGMMSNYIDIHNALQPPPEEE